MDFLYIGLWVVPSVLVGVYLGFQLGRSTHADRDTAVDRATLLKALSTLLTSTDKLRSDVDSHNTEIAQVGRNLLDLQVPGELQSVQRMLLVQITTALESNERLETDLIVARHRLEEQAVELDRTRLEARTDALSGVANRKAFDEKLEYYLAAWRSERTPLVLLLCDIDHFKRINDTHGHVAGDRVVGQIGDFLRQTLRGGDFVARYGGDEFAIVLANIDLGFAGSVAERIRAAIARRIFEVAKNQRVATTFSMGYAVIRDGDTAESLIRRADEGLYQAKQAGRNQVQTVERNDEPPPPAAESAVASDAKPVPAQPTDALPDQSSPAPLQC